MKVRTRVYRAKPVGWWVEFYATTDRFSAKPTRRFKVKRRWYAFKSVAEAAAADLL